MTRRTLVSTHVYVDPDEAPDWYAPAPLEESFMRPSVRPTRDVHLTLKGHVDAVEAAHWWRALAAACESAAAWYDERR